MNDLSGDYATSPRAADADYDEVMAKLNASLKRSVSVKSSSSGVNGDWNSSLEGPPNYIFGVTRKEIPLYEIDDEGYDAGDQLPSVEEARTTVASSVSRNTRPPLSGSPSAFDQEEEYEEQYKKFLRRPGEEAAYKRTINWYKVAFFVVIASVLGTVIGLAVGFSVGEEVEKLETEAQGGSGTVGTVTTAPSPTIQRVPTTPPSVSQPTSPSVGAAWPTAGSQPPSPSVWPTVVSQPTSPSAGAAWPTAGSQPPSPTATAAPTNSHVHNVFAWLVAQKVATPIDFTTKASYQYQAAHWIADQDEARLSIPETVGDDDFYTFIERYVMALFYLSTAGASWSDSVRFLSAESICSWNDGVTLLDSQIGVACNSEGRVSSINIPQNNVTGNIVTELGLLSSLDFLALNHNVLDGTVPSEMAALGKLSYLALHYNHLGGKLPQWIGEVASLRVLGLGDNIFTGLIPMEWSMLNNLVTLGLDNNSLEGDLSMLQGMTSLKRIYLEENNFQQPLQAVTWAQLSNLEELDLSGNSLSGTFPPDFVGLTKLRILDLGRNAITGELPSFDGLPALKYLALHSNKIGGSIPSSIANLGNLTHLDFSENKFKGQIPHQFGNLKILKYLFFANNKELASGQIPTFIGSLTNLIDLSFKGSNRVASIVPTLFSNLADLVLLELDDNLLTGEVPSQLGNLKSLTYLMLNRNILLTGTVPTEVQMLPKLDIILVDRTALTGDLNVMCTERSRKPEISGADCYGDDPRLECSCCNICCQDGMNVTDCKDHVYFGQLDPVWENSYQRRFYQFADQDFGTPGDNTGGGSNIGHDDVLGNGSNVTKPNSDDNNPAVRRSRMLARIWSLILGE